MKKIFGIAVLVLVCVGLFLGAFNSWSADPAPESKVIPKMKGGVLTSWYPSDYESNTVEQTLRQMKKDGCEYVAVMIVGYQDSVNSTRVYSLDGKSPTKAGIIHVTNYAHSLGLKVFFKPQINITNSDAWCGTITF